MPQAAGIADMVMPLGSRFFRGEPLPSDVEITNSLEEDDWLGRIYRKYARETDRRTRMIDLCEPFDTVHWWIDPDPNAQLILVWLLEYLRLARGHRLEAAFGASRPSDRQLPGGGGGQMADTRRQDRE